MRKTMTALAALAVGAVLALPVSAYEAGSVTGGGSITGKVTFKGAAPAPRQMAVTKDNQVCGTGTRQIVEVAVADGNLQNAVVYVAKIDKGKAWGPLDSVTLDQKGCMFIPDMLLVRKNADLTIRNSDTVLHNIHTYEIIGNVRRTMFNVGQPEKGDIKQPIKVRRANFIKVECDAHDFMHSWAFAADNPYVAVTKGDGSFAIGDLPPGDYEIKAWHPVLGEKNATVSVKAGAAASASFEFSK